MDEDAVRREVESEAEAIIRRMHEVVDGLRDMQVTYHERFQKVTVQTWTREDLLYLDDNGIDCYSVLPKEVRPE